MQLTRYYKELKDLYPSYRAFDTSALKSLIGQNHILNQGTYVYSYSQYI